MRKIIERQSGRSCQDVFDELLFTPLGMTRSEWRPRPQMVDPAGWTLSGLHSTARDMARFGLAVLAGGRWDGRDLGCDAGYLAASLAASQPLNPSYGMLWWIFDAERACVPGLRPGDAPDPRKAFGGIELARPLAPSAPRGTRGGMGAGDQRLYLVPERGLVVVRHGRPAGQMAAAGGGFDEQFWKRLAPALPGEEPGR